MQLYNNGQILYSPSDLLGFLGCRHASFLVVKSLNEKIEKAETSPTEQLLQKKGLEHEAAYLQRLKDEGKSVVEIPKDRNLQGRATLSLDAMKTGADLVYQAVFFDAPWRGDADFLIKCDTASKLLGDFSYEVLDTKLARNPEPKHIIQLCAYSDLLTKLQGLGPKNIHLFLGNGEKHSFRLTDYYYYYSYAKARFESYIQKLPLESYPEPCSHCKFCQWRDGCKAQWEADDHLSLVANIQRSQIDKLRRDGIRTVADLSARSPDSKIPDLNHNVFLRLRSQAVLQHHTASTGEDKFEIIPFPPGKGFSRMPAPDDGDLFFDMEGDPLYPNGLEYLFGVYYLKDGKKIFKPFWAHNHEEEKKTFKSFMQFLAEHLSKHPHAYIYHYSHYETTALKRLSCRYAVAEEQLDNLLRKHRFIDLYIVVRESVRTSEPGYSIKNLETFYMDKRTSAVSSAEDSIVAYNEWRETGTDELLQEIVGYNEEDCISTYLLRDWLLTLKQKYHKDEQAKEQKDKDKEPQERKDWEIEYEEYQKLLGVTDDNPPLINERIAHLLEFHNRETKPQWWARFDRQNKFPDELVYDTECLAELQQIGAPEPEDRSLIYTYTFPPQEYKLKVGSQAVNVAFMENIGSIVEIDDYACIVKIKRGKSRAPLGESLSIGPPRPIDTGIIRTAIYRYAKHFAKMPNRSDPATELLSRNMPRIQGKQQGEAIIGSEDLLGCALEAILALDNSYIFIQGPPGAGKTYTSSHIIVDLIKRGKKIGITSNSHKAIHNLLKKVEDFANEKGLSFRGVKKSSSNKGESRYNGQFIDNKENVEDMSLDADLFAGTAWAFSNPHFDSQLDYLFIDEAGQVSTANVVAMTMSSKNIILVGDQMQLGQPVQGTHPGEAGLSVLEFILGDQSTIPDERGIFLGQTYRMCPSICRFISDAFYDSRLIPHESTKLRSLNLKGLNLPDEGIVMVPVDSEACSQKSLEEGKLVETFYHELLGQSFTDSDGTTRPITENDILIVTPYNVQVNYLRSILPNSSKVGTVDKFQGQEAPIVIISMVTSSPEDLPRNIEFLYSKNRLNVAVSRAQCLTIMLANPKLLEVPCKTVEQMKLVNTFCWLYEYAVKVS